jgi:transcriptional regulator of acetoin/glycerol metabolism
MFRKSPLSYITPAERKKLITKALKDANHRVPIAAKVLGVSKNLLWRYIKALKIQHDGFAWLAGRVKVRRE